MPAPFEPVITALDETPDGACEVILEVRDRLVANTVLVPGTDSLKRWRPQLDELMAALRRRC
jgi:hypothetical protein